MTVATESAVRTFRIDPAHTQATFEVKHMMFAKVRGGFGSVEGMLRVGDWEDVDSWSATGEIDAASISTGHEQRDEHLRSPDFFDVATHPEITFLSTAVRQAGDRELIVTGDLTIRGNTRQVELEVKEGGRGIDPWGNERVAFSARTVIDRRDFGLNWNQALETGGILVGHEVTILLEVQATSADPA